MNYSEEAVLGSDGSLLWMWGRCAGTLALNPWSSDTWAVTSNPNGLAPDAFIVGTRDDGSSIGPWFSEGDSGAEIRVGLALSGDLIVAARSARYTTFNGGQDFIPEASGGTVLVRIDQSTGHIKWRKPITSLPTSIIAAPGNHIVVMSQKRDASNSIDVTAPYQVDIYAESDGTLLSSISAGMMAQVVAAGQVDLFVLGTVSAAADFDPGQATDSQGSTPGVYISRLSFE